MPIAGSVGTVADPATPEDGYATAVPLLTFIDVLGMVIGTEVTNGAEMEGIGSGCEDCCTFPFERIGEKYELFAEMG